MGLIRFLSFLSIAVSLAGCISSAPRFSSSTGYSKSGGEDTDESRTPGRITASHRVDTTKLMRVISEYLGTPYGQEGETGEGIDCSAFTQLVFEKAFMISLPRSTEEQYTIGQKIRKSDLIPGDLVFFNTTGRIPSHVGIFIGGGLFAHASITEGVTISSLSTPYYNNRYECARRVIR
jgi:cell wall-associated NlpC family hydrolase